jgi:hypothetical protein
MRIFKRRVVWLVTVAAAMSGCASSPIVLDRLKAVSAGYTGCAPEDNVLSNVALNQVGGSTTWNATCRGNTYLCSTVYTNQSESSHCAPAAQ